MKREGKRRGAKRWIVWGMLALIILYALAAIVPYAFPPSAAPEEVAVMISADAVDGGGERAAILETGEEALWGRLYLIESAQQRLRMASYLYACDESGERIGAALLRAADRGVKVEILVDGLIGAINFGGKDLPYALGTHENIEIRYYNPLNLLDPDGINARLHEKYLMADERLLILGGRNISDEFLTPMGHPSYNDDRDVMLWADVPGPGTGVSQMNAYFDALWTSVYTAPHFDTSGNAAALATVRAEMEGLLAETEAEKEAWFARIETAGFAVSVERTMLLHNPVEPEAKAPLLLDALGCLMAGAKERVWLQSPYFVLNGHMQSVLAGASSDGAQVRLYTNSISSGNNIVASADYLWQKGRVTAIGGELYESQKDYSSHTKCLLIDDAISVFGSFNFDMRSAYIDTEVMLAVYSEELNARLAEKIAGVQACSLQVTEGGYEDSSTVAPQEMAFGKRAMIYLLSPFLFLIRYLL